VQAVEGRARLDLGERAREVHVAEHLVRLERLVAAADEDGVSVVTDELEVLEVGNDGLHDEREYTLPLELACGCTRRRLQLLILDREAHLTELLGQLGARTGRVVRDEAQLVAGFPEVGDRLDGTGNRLAGDVEHAVDVQQNACHGA
jgi:hypothetical protein